LQRFFGYAQFSGHNVCYTIGTTYRQAGCSTAPAQHPARKGKSIMASKSNTPATPAAPAAPATPAVCTICGKHTTRAATIAAGMGATCAHMQAQFSTPQALQAHYAALTGNVPPGYVTLASVGRTIRAQQHNYPGLNVNKLVTAIGRDRAKNSPAHPICKPVYNGRQRYVNGWLATPAGLQAIATGNYSAAPKA
jgi:hypothetical protein